MTVKTDTATGKKVAPRITRRAALVGAAGAVLGAVAAPATAKATAPAPAPLPPAGTICPDGGVISHLPNGKQVKIYDLDQPAPQTAKDAQLARMLKQLERLPESHQHAFAEVVEVAAGKSDAILSPIALDIAQNMYRAWVKEGKPGFPSANFARLDEVIAATIRHMAANYRGTNADLLKGRELFFGGTQA